MPNSQGYYDIDCGSDVYLVKFAADNGNFRYIRIHADVAKTIDFSGGIRNINTIVLEKCFKLGRIIWPLHCGAIRSLSIHSADMLTRLDVSALTQLEQLYIVDCPALKEIVGLGERMKEFCVHQVKVNSFDLRSAHRIQKINISTFAPHVSLTATSLNQLQQVLLTSESTKVDATMDCHLTHCPALFRVAIDAKKSVLNLQVDGCHGLRECQLDVGAHSVVTGMNDCKELEYLSANDKLVNLKDMPQAKVAYRLQHNLVDKKADTAQTIADIQHEKTSFYPFVMTYKPGLNDRETIIQERTSQHEAGQKGMVKIELLGADFKRVRAVVANDFKMAKRSSRYGKYKFLTGPALIFYYVKDSAKWPEPEKMLPAARYGNDVKVIKEWRLNADKRNPNTLLVTEEILQTNPEFTQMMTDIGKKHQPRQSDAILLTGNLLAIKSRLPDLAGGISIISLDAISDYAAAVPSPQFSDKFAETYQYSQHTSEASRHETNQARMLANHFVEAYREASLVNEPRPSSSADHLPLRNSAIISRADLPDQQPVSAKSATPDEPIAIDAEASHQEAPAPERKGDFVPQRRINYDMPDPQIPIYAEASQQNTHAPTRKDDFVPQRRIDYDMPDTQVLVDAAAHAKERPLLQAASLFTEETHAQQLVNVDKKSMAPASHPEIHPQFFINAEAQTSTSPEARLLDASKMLADAMQQMLLAVETKSQMAMSRPVELSQAASLIHSAHSELSPAKYVVKLPEQQSTHHILRDSVFEAARELVCGLEQLNLACKLISAESTFSDKEDLASNNESKK